MQEAIKVYTEQLRHALQEGTSIDYPDSIWTLQNFENLRKVTNNNLKEGGSQNFDLKFLEQVEEAKKVDSTLTDEEIKVLIPLMAEVKSLYYVFISNIKRSSKIKGIEAVLNGSNELSQSLDLTIEHFPLISDALRAGGIGSGGMGINTNKQKEIFYIIDVLEAWFNVDVSKREQMLSAAGRVNLQNFVDGVAGQRSPQCRHIILYLLFPDYYQSICSTAQKRRICKVFKDFIDDELLAAESLPTEADEDLDQRIKTISVKLAEIRGVDTNFYSDEVRQFWDADRESSLVDIDTELLEYKKQLVLYGPPGTGKTYTAKALAKEVIRYRLALDLKASVLNDDGQQKLKTALSKNIHLLQLHPAYSYEDFVRGLQIKNGDTQFVKGYLLRLIDRMNEDPSLPHVLILDEINRVDLSRLFGECFSALENRDEPIDLLGADDDGDLSLKIPNNLYIIGTMNQIDHSVEQIDFALRRRFLWVEASYDSNALLSICEKQWEVIKWPAKVFKWEVVESDFIRLVQAADSLNNVIRKEDDLGGDFVLGHVFFLEAVAFLNQNLEYRSSKLSSGYLFKSKGEWRDPITKLWRMSLYPLLKEYLAGVDHNTKEAILKRLEKAFRPTNA